MNLLLLDTHLLLWAAAAEERLPRAARAMLADEANMLAFSVVSFFEVILKAQRLRKELGIEPQEYREGWLGAGYREIAVTGEHVVAAAACRRCTRTRSTACWSRRRSWKARRC